MQMALVLSQRIEMVPTGNPKSSTYYFSQRTWATELPKAMYLALVVERATEFCFLLDQQTKDCPMN